MRLTFTFIFFLVLLLVSCGETQVKDAPKVSSSKSVDHKAAAPIDESDQLDYRNLFENSQQESLDFYSQREQVLQQSESIGKLKADSYLKALLSPAEEGTQRKIKYGDRNGFTLEKDQAYFIVIDERLPDDSIESDIRFFELRKTSKSWSLSTVTSVWRCYKGRGHQDYSTALCN